MILFQDELLRKHKDYVYCWLFNIGIEDEWSGDRFRMKNPEEDIVVQHMEEILLLLAHSEDILLLRNIPEEKFLRRLKEMGFQIPQMICPQKEDLSLSITELVLEDSVIIKKLQEYTKQKQVYLLPYGVTEKEEQLSRVCGMQIKGSSADVTQKMNSKLYGRELIRRLHLQQPVGKICYSLEGIQSSWEKLSNEFQRVVIKRPYGASGQGIYLVDSSEKLRRVLHLLKRLQGREEKWIVEGWYEKKIDINAQLYIHDNGDIEIFSVKEQLLDDTVYYGSVFPVSLSEKIMDRYQKELNVIGKHLYDDGARGVVGIDSIITEQEIFPVIEINVRFTLSTYLSKLPLLFFNRYFQSIYYRVPVLGQEVYEKLENQLEHFGIAFSREKSEGIFFYNYSCMNREVVGECGRLFTIIVAKDKDRLHQLQTQIEKLLEESGIRVWK